MLEYAGTLSEKNWDATYSFGRILDKFYSMKWNEISLDTFQPAAFLKKSWLFDELGIIGICNKYLRKFENCSTSVIDNCKALSSSNDLDIRQQATKLIAQYSKPIIAVKQAYKKWDGSNGFYGVERLGEKYDSICKHKAKEDDRQFVIRVLLAGISYIQLGQAITIAANDTAREFYKRYDFIKSDFGFDVDTDDSLKAEEVVDLKTR